MFKFIALYVPELCLPWERSALMSTKSVVLLKKGIIKRSDIYGSGETKRVKIKVLSTLFVLVSNPQCALRLY